VTLIPTRYPGTPAEGDGAAQLARATTWIEVGRDVFRGTGQRILATDQGDTPLMDLRALRVDAADGPAEAAVDG
jgi:type VI secretion system protein ImpE